MTKRFPLWAACALTLITPLTAQEGEPDVAKLQADRERLVDLVLSLQADFGETIRDFAKLQQDYATLLKRPEVPDQSGKVKELQKQLASMTKNLKTREDAGKKDEGPGELTLFDLKTLRTELHRERSALLVAKAQLLQFQQLEGKATELEKLLKEEATRGADTMAMLQAVRGERDALLTRLDDMLKKAETSEKERVAANTKIEQLEKETVVLKKKIALQDTEIAKLKGMPDPDEALLLTVTGMKKEEARLTAALQEREKELLSLRESLMAETKKNVDVPMMLKARKDLEAQLMDRQAEALKASEAAELLKLENADLKAKYQVLTAQFNELQASIKLMEGELAKNKEAMMAVSKAGEEMKQLAGQRDDLTRSLATAKAKIVEVETGLKAATEKLKLSEKLKADFEAVVTQVKKLETEKATLAADLAIRSEKLKTFEVEVAKNQEVSKLAIQEAEMNKARVSQLTASLAANKKALDDAQMQMKKTTGAAEAESEKLKAEYTALVARAEALEKEKSSLAADLVQRDESLQALKLEMTKKPDMSEVIKKLEVEKKELVEKLAARDADLKKTRTDLGKLHLDSAAMEKQLVSLKRSTVQVDPVRYAKGEADVTDQQARVLSQVQQVLKLFPAASFEIVGHTCDLGSKEGNLKLSRERAQALHDFLAEKGIPAERLKFRGVADADPVVPNTNEENRQKNRRVEIEILD